MDKKLIFGLICLFDVCLLSAQDRENEPDRKKKRVDLLYAGEVQADKQSRPDVQVPIGSVGMKHDSTHIFCDGVLIYEKIDSVEAFGNVRVEQGDILLTYGDYLYYDGMSQLVMLCKNVHMINHNTELTTDSLSYDRLYNLDYYFDGGTSTNEEGVLTSEWGEYSLATKLAVFDHEMRLVNPKFILTSDTLKYSTESKIATILGPSDIVSDKNHIYSERGTYNIVSEQAELLGRSALTNESKRLADDSLLYDCKPGYGEAFDNVQMNDTVNKNMFTGDYCFYNELVGNAIATRRAIAINYSQGDSLFMHGDTLWLVTYNPNTDSTYRETHVYHEVRAYRTDVQAVCDSLIHDSKDSCMTMCTDPVLWHGTQQLLGEEIKVYMNDSTIDWAHITNQALAVEQRDSTHYNQVTGKEMKVLLISGDMRCADINGNALIVSYPEEKGSTITGMNYAEGSFLCTFLKDRKIEEAALIGKSNGMLYPMDQIPADKMRLPPFVWFDYIRPLNKYDIFEWRGKKAGETLQKSDRKPLTSPRDMHIK